MASTEAAAELPSELDVGDALALAVQLHRKGHLDDAETLYRRILEVEPEHTEALVFLGAVSMHRGRVDEAIGLIRKAIALEPARADFHNNFGNVLLAADRVDDAVAAYRKAIALEPAHADAWNNLAIILAAQKNFVEAARAYERAIEIDPEHAPAYTNYGNLRSKTGDISGALRCYAKSLTLRPRDVETRHQLAIAYALLGKLDQAAAIYREWLETDPDNVAAKHYLAACSGVDVPERAADNYIEKAFDRYSARFDASLAGLEYRAPELVAEALRHAVPRAGKQLGVLDAGCGTGLCAPLIAPYAARLEGVDLSSGMIEKARARGFYDELVKAELTAHLQSRRDAYDLIVSADTLVYFGVLDDALSAAARALRPGGLLIFTVEHAQDAAAPAGHRLNYHGRYSHTRDYVERTLREAGFDEVRLDHGVLRQEGGQPVHGLVVTAGKRALESVKTS